MGNGVTYGSDLKKICKQLFPNFIGVFAQDEKQPDQYEKCCYILNTSNTNENGEHWVAVWNENNNIYVFDSFGRSIERLLPYFNNLMGGGIIYNDNKKQYDYQEDCGQRCISFLLLAQKYGIKKAIKL